MSNTINLTVELGLESQAKLDKILAALEKIGRPNCKDCVEAATTMVVSAMKPEAEPTETDTAPTSAAEPAAPETGHPVDEVSPHGEPKPAVEPEQPEYTKADVLAMVQKLAAPTSSKREQAKAIIKSYGAKVSDVPEDKYPEVMAKLVKLDKEG